MRVLPARRLTVATGALLASLCPCRCNITDRDARSPKCARGPVGCSAQTTFVHPSAASVDVHRWRNHSRRRHARRRRRLLPPGSPATKGSPTKSRRPGYRRPRRRRPRPVPWVPGRRGRAAAGPHPGRGVGLAGVAALRKRGVPVCARLARLPGPGGAPREGRRQALGKLGRPPRDAPAAQRGGSFVVRG